MAKLLVTDDVKASVYSFSPSCKTTEQAQAELGARGWSHADALEHINAAIRSGAYSKVESERVRAQTAEETDGGQG